MRLFSSILIIIFFPASVLWSQNKVSDKKVIRILSFNILHGATTKGDFDLDTIASVITRTQPDLVALQEVDYKTKRAKQYDLVTELGWRTKMQALFGRAMHYDGGEYGEGVLSKYSLLSSRKVDLPYSPGHEPRTALEITLQLPSGDTISFVGTHFDHTRDETDRIAQAKKVDEVFSNNRFPTILAGDLNAEPGTLPITLLERNWLSAYDKRNITFTYPSNHPKKKIDYVLMYLKVID